MRPVVPRLLLAVLLAAAALAAAAPGDDARLRALEERYRQHLLVERPDLGSRFGIERADEQLVPLTTPSLERDAALLAALSDSLGTIRRDALAPARRAALDSLAAHVAFERAPLLAGRWQREAAPYAELVDSAVFDAATRRKVVACARMRRALQRLRSVPELLRAAEITLRAGAVTDRDTALAHLASLQQRLRVALPALSLACHEADRNADLVEADTLALVATRRFAGFLAESRDSLPR